MSPRKGNNFIGVIKNVHDALTDPRKFYVSMVSRIEHCNAGIFGYLLHVVFDSPWCGDGFFL